MIGKFGEYSDQELHDLLEEYQKDTTGLYSWKMDEIRAELIRRAQSPEVTLAIDSEWQVVAKSPDPNQAGARRQERFTWIHNPDVSDIPGWNVQQPVVQRSASD